MLYKGFYSHFFLGSEHNNHFVVVMEAIILANVKLF